MKSIRKFFYWNNYRNYISFELGYLPMCQIGIDFGEDITFSIGCFIQFYVSLNIVKLNHWLYKHKIYDRALKFYFWFGGNDGTITKSRFAISVNLMSDDTGWKKGGWRWYMNISDKLKGKFTVSKKIIEIKDILIPMPEKSYKARAVLADWTWHFPRWFPKTIKRCEIEIPEGLPHAGKGENSWDCGDDATFGLTTGKVRSISQAVGELVGMTLETRVKNGGWDDWNWKR
jgi:hypothetical protein